MNNSFFSLDQVAAALLPVAPTPAVASVVAIQMDKAAIMAQFASIFATTTMSLPTVMSDHEYTADTLAARVGVPLDVMRRALGMVDSDDDRVLLSVDEQRMLHTLGCYIQDRDAHAYMREAAMRDSKNVVLVQLINSEQQVIDMTARIKNLKQSLQIMEAMWLESEAELDTLQCGRIKWMRHPEFQVLSVRAAVSDILDEVREFIAEPSRDEASDVAFGLGRLIGACLGKKYVRFFGDGLHVAKCNARHADYGHFRSKRALAAQ